MIVVVGGACSGNKDRLVKRGVGLDLTVREEKKGKRAPHIV